MGPRFYHGPYRVEETLPSGRVKLRDLENRLMHDEFDVSNLRPYRGNIAEGDLADDEWILDCTRRRALARPPGYRPAVACVQR